MKNNIGIVCHVDFGKTTITDLAMQKAAELQNEVVVLEEKNKMQFDREVVIPITAIPDSMDRYEEPKFIDLKPFYHRFSKNHKKEEKMTYNELQEELKALTVLHRINIDNVHKKYAAANNPYKVGDEFTDHIGTIVIKSIFYDTSAISGSACVYEGNILNKSGKLSNKIRKAW